MDVLHGLTELRRLPSGSILSIGNFDGMHRGHRKLLETAAELKSSARAPATVVVTFEPHPLTVLRPEQAPPRLTRPDRKRDLLAATGVDVLVILPPAADVLDLSAEQFWQILRDEARPAHLVEGGSFSFGKNRAGTIEKLREWCVGTSVGLDVIDSVEVVLPNMVLVPVSSSVIRWLLAQGRVREAGVCLGRAYELRGLVVEGAKRGRELGVPTANLECIDELVPGDGVYAGRCIVKDRAWPAAISIGTNPTFGNNPRTVEVHLVGFVGDLYGQVLCLEFLDWQRDQLSFCGVDALKSRISRDIEETLDRAAVHPREGWAGS